ncbi:hypothetical protein [Photobacterium leiognathi]|uniref:hypothetical protein n=1 Tax=Photobacterium leiognathi TaxID=553611 RepID=UPI0029823D03|nr:hypothetical protein [Photobacterium leiognathi]
MKHINKDKILYWIKNEVNQPDSNIRFLDDELIEYGGFNWADLSFYELSRNRAHNIIIIKEEETKDTIEKLATKGYCTNQSIYIVILGIVKDISLRSWNALDTNVKILETIYSPFQGYLINEVN